MLRGLGSSLSISGSRQLLPPLSDFSSDIHTLHKTLHKDDKGTRNTGKKMQDTEHNHNHKQSQNGNTIHKRNGVKLPCVPEGQLPSASFRNPVSDVPFAWM